MGIFGDNKVEDCETDENGVTQCRIGIRTKNSILNTGTQFSGVLDNACKFKLSGRSTIVDEDEDAVKRAIKRIESSCRGGDSIN